MHNSEVQRRTVDLLIEEIQAGVDRDWPFEEIFKRYYRLIRHFFRQRGLKREEAESCREDANGCGSDFGNGSRRSGANHE